jgi:hypothetical protein
LLPRAGMCYPYAMSNMAEIEAAIEKLPKAQVDQLAHWLETLRQSRTTPPPVEKWLHSARGAALPGVKTDNIMAVTRGEG